jgi:hypothetical protein
MAWCSARELSARPGAAKVVRPSNIIDSCKEFSVFNK